MMTEEEGVDTFTLLHESLHAYSNSVSDTSHNFFLMCKIFEQISAYELHLVLKCFASRVC